ncbi:NAD(P)/FAD-dependent oxidoreductase [Candidatus Leptofilum sp.]|uniref:NAD(P)/FAD-dependent oxidoreductase n=1 Tax=Candidatus Leptofilum sp. TaxID=3241576 RepID=UPI003B5C5645
MVNNGNIPKSCDVVVMGGGPAGSHAATLLAQRGYEVVLFEKARFPRPMVGESLIPHFWKFMDHSGVTSKIEAADFLAKAGGITVWNGRIHQFSFSAFGYDRPALHVERDVFDDVLLRHAESEGATVFEEVSVKGVDFSDPKPIVSYHSMQDGTRGAGKIQCRYVIDASGNSSILAKQFKSRRLVEGHRTFLGMWGYFTGGKYIGVDGSSYGTESIGKVAPVTFISSHDDGWAWHIQLKDKISIGLIINTSNVKRMGKKEMEPYFLSTVRNIPYFKELLEDATYQEGSMAFRPDYSFYSTKPAGPNFGCIGDAGAFVDPIFSHGCQAAFYSASVCAWAAESAFRRPDRAENYGRLLQRRLQQHYGFSRSLALGDYGGDGVDPDLVIDLMKSMPLVELEMMLVASDISNRSTNFHEMAKQAGILEEDFADGIMSGKARVLDTLNV